MKVFIYRGLPASGKSTAALKYIKDHPDTLRCNRDDINKALYRQHYDPKINDVIKRIEETIILEAERLGRDVIIDDTNIPQSTIDWIKSIPKNPDTEFVEVSFLDVPLEVCLERNRKREEPVPEIAIRSLYNKIES